MLYIIIPITPTIGFLCLNDITFDISEVEDAATLMPNRAREIYFIFPKTSGVQFSPAMDCVSLPAMEAKLVMLPKPW